MSTQPQTPFNVSEFLVRARQACQETKPKLSVQEIWFRFRTAGGHDGHSAVKSWLYGWTKPDVDQYVVLASVLNQHLVEHDRADALCPVFSFSPGGRGDGASSDSVGSADADRAKGGYQAPEIPLRAVSGL